MTKTFKMLTVQAMLNTDTLPGRIAIDALTAEVARVAKRSAALRADVGTALNNSADLRRLIETNPIVAWAHGGRANVERFFAYEDGVFRTLFSVEPDLRESFREAGPGFPRPELLREPLRPSRPGHHPVENVDAADTGNGRRQQSGYGSRTRLPGQSLAGREGVGSRLRAGDRLLRRHRP